MNIILKQSNILDIEAQVLICSANVSLNLTGGVGADIVARYGNTMQQELHDQLKGRARCFAEQGEVFACYTEGLPYKAVLHAVAVDPMYHSSVEMITQTVKRSFEIAKECEAESVALTCLASGFGDLTLEDFVEGLWPILSMDWEPIKKLYLVQIENYRFKELSEAVQKICGEYL